MNVTHTMKRLYIEENVTTRLSVLNEDASSLENRSVMAFTPEELKVAMAALQIRQSKLYDMRNDIDKAIAFNAELHQRFAEVWTVEGDAIETRLSKARHEEETRIAAQANSETSHSVSNGSADATNS